MTSILLLSYYSYFYSRMIICFNCSVFLLSWPIFWNSFCLKMTLKTKSILVVLAARVLYDWSYSNLFVILDDYFFIIWGDYSAYTMTYFLRWRLLIIFWSISVKELLPMCPDSVSVLSNMVFFLDLLFWYFSLIPYRMLISSSLLSHFSIPVIMSSMFS